MNEFLFDLSSLPERDSLEFTGNIEFPENEPVRWKPSRELQEGARQLGERVTYGLYHQPDQRSSTLLAPDTPFSDVNFAEPLTPKTD